jgi:hypothetical protein
MDPPRTALDGTVRRFAFKPAALLVGSPPHQDQTTVSPTELLTAVSILLSLLYQQQTSSLSYCIVSSQSIAKLHQFATRNPHPFRTVHFLI